MREPASQWVNCLAIVLGGLAIFLPQLSPYLAYLFINFFVAGAILGFFWPERGWQWGLWLAIPSVIVGLISLIETHSIGDVTGTAIAGGQAVVAGSLMGWLGSKFSPRRLPFPMH